ncbi:Uncharacterized conserved protein [Plasmopara halstedii]|uniref:Uncharacterized conserved protein n=1 Tax=Plasmopara halstedii TaxID=4781 RepID=A0A0P1A7I5_PLAHL|nr:Uncharacterized conserved protein [Plasmopara halstedii]CEG36630.1 Uncharacterized conserved protein [Plasmopara halstedii]|eukprot:XP_024572999.1 Uncharacterized conserved protein [Plasmopara halstedii]
MGRKLVALVPSTLSTSVNLERFHSDAQEYPFLSIVSWTSRPSADSRRSRQLALDKNKCQLLELQKLQPVEGSRSWFVGNFVMENGGVMIFSPVDAHFVLLDALSGQHTRISPLYDLLARDGNTWLLQLSTLRQEMIEMLCDVHSVGSGDGVENILVKINRVKVTSWLRAKVEKVAVVLAKHELDVRAKVLAIDEQITLPGLTKQNMDRTAAQDITKHYREAIKILGEYISEEWVEVLRDSFNIEVVEVTATAKLVSQDTFKRFDRRHNTENGPKRLTPSSASSTKKKSKLDSVDRSGMKSLTSFFSKK